VVADDGLLPRASISAVVTSIHQTMKVEARGNHGGGATYASKGVDEPGFGGGKRG